MFSIVQKEYNTDIIQLDKYILSSRHKIDMINILSFSKFLWNIEILKKCYICNIFWLTETKFLLSTYKI